MNEITSEASQEATCTDNEATPYDTNAGQASRFLEVLHGQCDDDQYAVLSWKSAGKLTSGSFRLGEQEELVERAMKLALSTDVYIRVCPTAVSFSGGKRGKKRDSAALPALYIDLDIGKDNAPATREDALALLAELVPVEPTMLVNSGNGLHCYFVLTEPITEFELMQQVERAWKSHIKGGAKQRGYTLDSVFDVARVLRMPGTFNFKAEPKPVELLECHPERLYSVDDLLPDGGDIPDAEPKQTADPAPATRHSVAENIATIVDVLPRIPDHHIDEYQTWLEIGMAIHSVLPDDAGLALWRERSMVSANYKEGCCEEKWRTFEHKPGGVGIGTLVYLAQDQPVQQLKISGGGSLQLAATGVGRAPSPGNTTEPIEVAEQADSGTTPDEFPAVLDPQSPMDTAIVLVQRRFMDNGSRTLHFYRGDFYRWTGSHYQIVENKEARAEVYRFCKEAVAVTKDKKGKEVVLPFNPNKSKVDNIMDALPAVVGLPPTLDAPCWLDKQDGDPEPSQLFAMGNGLFDLSTGELHPHSPRFFDFNAVDYAYDPAAGMPKRWLEFLSQLWPDDPEATRALQQWFGYCLTHATDLQKILLLIGPKRSGKGTIGRVLTALLGQDNVAGPTLAGLSTNFGLSTLIGKPLAIIADARISGRADQAAIAERLLSISGEDSLTIDRKYKDAWTGKLSTRFMIMTNELPRLADASGALASRFVVLCLDKSFYGHEDHRLTERLLAELPSIFNWAVEGWRDLQATGKFVEPRSSQEAIADLESLGSPISAFIDDCCEVGPNCEMPVRALFGAWQHWCRNNGRDYSGNLQSFCRDLKAAVPGLATTQRRVGGIRQRVMLGIAADDPSYEPR